MGKFNSRLNIVEDFMWQNMTPEEKINYLKVIKKDLADSKKETRRKW